MLLKSTETVSETIIAYMQDHLDQNITLDELSNIVHLEKSHLVRFFRNETGKTSIESLIEMRLTKASDLVATSDLCIYEIATQCGYNTVSFFISKYKQRYGMTPEVHRRVLKQLN
ncbi:MAG: helix-turn-helix transcriptional regulator [Lachnospiraceae bacterium]|nr:helix-turn-helix transcriptional regulator [Lachnospiraceae bacterium]